MFSQQVEPRLAAPAGSVGTPCAFQTHSDLRRMPTWIPSITRYTYLPSHLNQSPLIKGPSGELRTSQQWRFDPFRLAAFAIELQRQGPTSWSERDGRGCTGRDAGRLRSVGATVVRRSGPRREPGRSARWENLVNPRFRVGSRDCGLPWSMLCCLGRAAASDEGRSPGGVPLCSSDGRLRL